MFISDDQTLNWLILAGLLFLAAFLGIFVVRRRGGGGPSNQSGLEFQLADSLGSALASCPKCGALTKSFYENCPVCGQKIGEKLAVAKTI